MNTVTSLATATNYAILVDGHLDDHWSSRLAGLAITRNGDGTSTLTGPVADQAQLHGVLAGLRDIAATLLDLRTTGPAPASEPGPGAVRPVLEHPLRTERLLLRPGGAGDADSTWRYRRLESVNEWLTGRAADLDAYRELFAGPARLAATVVVQLGHTPDAEVIGDLMLRREDAWAQFEVADDARGVHAEIGWVLDPAHSGRGYATEAVRELLRYGFDELGLRRVTAECFLDNEASWRLMERVGMRRELHAVRDALHRSEGWLDSAGYALLAEERGTLSGGSTLDG